MSKVDILSIPSVDSAHTLYTKVYCPDTEIRGFFQIVHGMAEHIERYDTFMQKMASEGWICFGHNHLGHKASVKNDSELGFIAKRGGDKLLVADVGNVARAVMEKYSKEAKLPYVLMGHSMGSFTVRLASLECSPDKLIIMGTGGKNPLASIGLALIAIIKFFCGAKHVSKLVDNIAFGTYNDHFDKSRAKEDPSQWLSTDESVRQKYYDDKYCGFKFSVSAMGDLIRMIKKSNSDGWYAALPKDMPILLVSGSDDPVGNYAAGVHEVENKLRKKDIPTECVIYGGARHEILNDFSRENVIEDILEFVK